MQIAMTVPILKGLGLLSGESKSLQRYDMQFIPRKSSNDPPSMKLHSRWTNSCLAQNSTSSFDRGRC